MIAQHYLMLNICISTNKKNAEHITVSGILTTSRFLANLFSFISLIYSIKHYFHKTLKNNKLFITQRK